METRLVRIHELMADDATNDTLAKGFADNAEETVDQFQMLAGASEPKSLWDGLTP